MLVFLKQITVRESFFFFFFVVHLTGLTINNVPTKAPFHIILRQ